MFDAVALGMMAGRQGGSLVFTLSEKDADRVSICGIDTGG